jgi:hypothetical protein
LVVPRRTGYAVGARDDLLDDLVGTTRPSARSATKLMAGTASEPIEREHRRVRVGRPRRLELRAVRDQDQGTALGGFLDQRVHRSRVVGSIQCASSSSSSRARCGQVLEQDGERLERPLFLFCG